MEGKDENRNCCVRLADPRDGDCRCCASEEEVPDYPPSARVYNCLYILFAFLTSVSIIVISFKLGTDLPANRNRCNASCGYLSIPIFFFILTVLTCVLHVRKTWYI